MHLMWRHGLDGPEVLNLGNTIAILNNMVEILHYILWKAIFNKIINDLCARRLCADDLRYAYVAKLKLKQAIWLIHKNEDSCSYRSILLQTIRQETSKVQYLF